jgi:HEPN domain-containing protein
MLKTDQLKLIAEARLHDAGALLSTGRYDGAVYLCGYAVEIALKTRIVKTLGWDGFPEKRSEFDKLKSFQAHDLDMLLHLSGWELEIKAKFLDKWSDLVGLWDTELRYKPPEHITEADAKAMIENVTQIIGALL